MTKTILITGASSGIGKTTALYFADRGWNVAATMRNPENATGLQESNILKKYMLDVESPESIARALDEAIKDFGRIDVLLNNAGYGAAGPLEFATTRQITRQFNVNVHGLINVTKGILPHFRTNKSGRIVNLSSMGGKATFPYFSLYHATKFAVDGFSECLNYELNPLGIDVKIIEPGAVQTDFTGRSMEWFEGDIEEYNPTVKRLRDLMENAHATKKQIPSKPEDVAEVIYKAATTKGTRLRYVIGKDAKTILAMRKILGVPATMNLVRKMYKL